MITISQVLSLSQQQIRNAGISTYQLDSEILVAHILRVERAYLFTHPDEIITKNKSKKILFLIQKRCKRIPIAYLLRKKDFFGHEFFVDQSVLIPRPDTEVLVQCVLEYISKQPHTQQILDIGIGSGCIAISLALVHPHIRFIGIDTSLSALRIARKNCSMYGLTKKISLLQSSYYPAHSLPFDVIISNPPYLSLAEYTLSRKKYPELSYEPKKALISQKKGVAAIETIIKNAPRHLAVHGSLFLEIGSGQRSAIKFIAGKYLSKATVQFYKDLAGRTRVAHITL